MNDVLPRLKPGVIIGFHDIFLPFHYPERWVRDHFFTNEQYVLQAFLAFNSDFEARPSRAPGSRPWLKFDFARPRPQIVLSSFAMQHAPPTPEHAAEWHRTFSWASDAALVDGSGTFFIRRRLQV
eukprot:tig00021281_g19908.t1